MMTGGALQPDLNSLLTEHRTRLRRMIELRMDHRVQGRLDASDVIQEAYVEAAERYHEYQAQRLVSPFVWLRFLTVQKLIQLQRRHLGALGRTVKRELASGQAGRLAVTSAVLAAQLVGKLTSPSQAVNREEQRQQVQAALDELEVIDREVLALRHFEQLTNAETAEVLEIASETAYKRYIRALQRLRGKLNIIESSDVQQP